MAGSAGLPPCEKLRPHGSVKGRSSPLFLKRSTTNRTGACVNCCHCSESNSSAKHSKAQQHSSGSATCMSPCSRALMHLPPTLRKQPARGTRATRPGSNREAQLAIAFIRAGARVTQDKESQFIRLHPAQGVQQSSSIRLIGQLQTRHAWLDGVKNNRLCAVLVDEEVRAQLYILRPYGLTGLRAMALHGLSCSVGCPSLLVGWHWHRYTCRTWQRPEESVTNVVHRSPRRACQQRWWCPGGQCLEPSIGKPHGSWPNSRS